MIAEQPSEGPGAGVRAHGVLRDAVLVAVATFAIYAAGACRTIYVGDSGELVAAAATLGIPHPSGYPLYVLIGKLWTLLVPLGSIAWRMSLFSAACAAATCGLFHLTVRRLGFSSLTALFASLLVAFGPSFWSQANIQRVYALNAFFLVAVTAAALEWYRDRVAGGRRIRWMVLAAFLAGVGATNHTVMGVMGLAVGAFALVSEPGLLRRPRHLAACVGAGLLGLVPYVYLPLASRTDPRLDWGNPETAGGFLDVVLRRDFWHRAWMESPADWLPIAGDYFASLGQELAWAGAALAVLGAALGWRRQCLPPSLPPRGRWPVLLPLLAMAANLWAVGVHGSRSDIFIWHRYYIPSYVMAALLAAFGVEIAVRRWGRRAAAAALLVPLALFVLGYPRYDRSRFRVAEDFSRTLLDSLPPGAHLSASDDNILFVLIYLHLVEGVRPDVDLIMQGVGDAELGQLRFDPDTDPLYFTHYPNWSLPALDVVPVGLVFRTVRAGVSPKPVISKSELDGAWNPRVPKDYLTQNLIGHFHYMLGVTFETRDWPRAQAEFTKATAAAPGNDVLFFNLGLIYRRNGFFRRSLEAFEHSAAINPRHIPSGRPVRAEDKVAELRREVAALATLERELLSEAGLAELEAGSGAYHRRLAELLEARGEALAARGHRLLAMEAGVVAPSSNRRPSTPTATACWTTSICAPTPPLRRPACRASGWAPIASRSPARATPSNSTPRRRGARAHSATTTPSIQAAARASRSSPSLASARVTPSSGARSAPWTSGWRWSAICSAALPIEPHAAAPRRRRPRRRPAFVSCRREVLLRPLHHRPSSVSTRAATSATSSRSTAASRVSTR